MSREPSLPTGTVTFLFTDIEGSSRLWEQYPEAMKAALAHHDTLLRQAIQSHGGLVFKTVGDAFYTAFATAPGAVAAALAAQQVLLTEEWGETGPLRVRMALHTGIAEARAGDYFGSTLNRVSRLLDAAHGSQILLSLPTEELVQEALPEGASLRPLGEHRLKDLVRPEHVFQLLHPDLPSTFPPLRSLAAFTHNLPLQWTSFVGRDAEMAELKRLLPTTSLLTLTGPGGCGKTRLALQVAADLLDVYRDGVWLVELAALAEPALVPQSVAAALGLPEAPGRSRIATLVEHLRSRSLLLVLDNCEHLLGACAQLTEALLRTCPNVRILATSRERLGLTGERAYPVPSLSLPELPPSARGAERVAAALRSEAVWLFVERAVYSQPRFALTEQNAPVVAQLCQRLDGIPLALELAAARVKALPVEQLTLRLDNALRLLTGGSRTALPRQQTLRALIDWSYDLLTEAERALLGRLSVFAGGWTAAAAEAVCGREGVEAWEVLDGLTSLVEKSLVLYEERGGEARYRLLETVRQYARDRLLEGGEAEAVRGRHRDWFLTLAEAAAVGSGGPEQGAWLERLETEHDNLRVAQEWSGKHEPEGALRLAGALWRFWMVRGYLGEGRERLEAALRGAEQHAELHRSGTRARALDGAGFLAYQQGDHAAARPLLEESLGLFRELEDKEGIATCLSHLGLVAYRQGDYPAARSLLEESLAMLAERGDKGSLALVLIHLGRVACVQGDYPVARSLLEESLTIFRERGDKDGIAHCLNVLGRVAYEEGEYSAARSLTAESLTIRRGLGAKLAIPEPLESLARSAAQGREWERAARLWGAAAALREAIGALPASHWEAGERELGAARAALGEAAFAAAWAEGRAMTLEQAMCVALSGWTVESLRPQPEVPGE